MPFIVIIRFDAKYTQIDALFVEGWSIEGLVKVVWPSKPKGDKFAVSKNATTVRTEVFRGTNTLPIVGDADVTLQKTHRIQR